MLQKNQISLILFVILSYMVKVKLTTGNLNYEVPKELPQPPHCGRTLFDDDDDGIADRIVGGYYSADGAWPWMALLGTYFETHDSINWVCVGSIISTKWILTAAHCYYDAGQALNWTRMGANHLTVKDKYTVDMKVFTTLYPDYRENVLPYDIALARMDQEIQFTERIRPICLPYQHRFRHTDFENEYPYVAGWGSTKFGDVLASKNIMQLQLKIVNRKQCAEVYKKLKVIINNKQICTGYVEEVGDTCQGDSGGPLMLYDEITEAFFEIGIVTFGYQCAVEGHPSVNTKVSDHDYLEWIRAEVTEG